MAATLAEPDFWTAPLVARHAEALAIFAPTSTEFRIVARRLQPTKGRLPPEFSRGLKVKLGRLGKFEACLIRSGVGQEPTKLACVRFLPRPFGHALLIGFAGGLEDGLPAGSLVRPERVIGPGDLEFTASDRLAALGGQRGPIVAASQVLADPRDKRLFHATSGARIVDLESVAFAFSCHRHAVPFTVLRAVTDGVGEALSPRAAKWLRPDGRIAGLRIARDLFRGPAVWRTLARLARNAREAAAALDSALDRLSDSQPY